jgi:hypothetical protein
MTWPPTSLKHPSLFTSFIASAVLHTLPYVSYSPLRFILSTMPFTTLNPSSDEKVPDLAKAAEAVLARMGVDVDDMLSFLSESKGVIAGSFPLSVLLTEMKSKCAFRPNDIDIWAEEKPVRPPAGYMLSSVVPHWDMGSDRIKKLFAFKDNNLTEKDIKKIVEWFRHDRQIWAIPDSEEDPYNRLRSTIKSIYKYKSVSSDRQLPDLQIIVTKGSPFDAIESFDIDVCQVVYDGKVFQIHSQLKMANITGGRAALTGNASSLQSNKEWIRTLRRMIKYSQRGYSFDTANFISTMLEEKKFTLGDMMEWNRVATLHAYNYPFGVVSSRIPVFFDGWTLRLRKGVVVGSGSTSNKKKGDTFKSEVSFGFLEFEDNKIVNKTTLWRGEVSAGDVFNNLTEERMGIFLLERPESGESAEEREAEEDLDLASVAEVIDEIAAGNGKAAGSDDDEGDDM